MHIRTARPADIDACANISAEAFLDDELIAWLFPNRHQYFGDYQRECLREIRDMYYKPGFVIWVAESEEGDDLWDDRAQVVGFTSWYRHGVSETALKWHKDSVSNKIQRLLQWIITLVQNLVTPDRSADASRAKQFSEGTDLFESIIERWHLSNIAVHPSYQRRGIASRLTRWGLKIASGERVPVTLEATISAEPLYRHVGFRDYSYNCLAEEVDGPALIWEPEGLEDSYGTNFPPREMLIGRGKGRQWKPIDAYRDGQGGSSRSIT